jgi:hypothetical protein
VRKLPQLVLTIIGAILLYFIISERWIGTDHQQWKLTVDSDGKGYYAYLPAIFIYQDLEYNFILKNEAKIYGKGEYPTFGNGQKGNKYFVGEALLLSPFFLLAWFISWVLGQSLDGYNMLFFGSVSIGALFYLLTGLVFIRKLLKLYDIKETLIQVILIIIVFGTNVFYYVVYEPSMSHIYSFAGISGFLFFTKKYLINKRDKQIYFSAFSLGIISLIRPVNTIIVLCVPFLAGTKNELKEFIQKIFKQKRRLLICIFIFLSITSIQLLIYILTYGNVLRWPYPEEGFNFLKPHFWDTLFSFQKGLFIYTPFIFICILFIMGYFRNSRFAFWTFVIFFIVLNYILSSWHSWFYGGSFGLRAFLEFYPFFIIPIAVGLNSIKNIVMYFIGLLFLLVMGLNIFQTYQITHLIIHFSDMDREKYWKVFLKTDPHYKLVSYAYDPDILNEKKDIKQSEIINDFEHGLNWGFGNTVTNKEFYSASHGVELVAPNCFSPTYGKNFDEIAKSKITFIRVSIMVKVPNINCNTSLVISF